MPIEMEKLKTMKAPFECLADAGGEKATVSGFDQNDPLGVGGGIFPDMPVVYFEGGGWVLVADFCKHFSLPENSK